MTLAPQMRQSLELLQVPMLELRTLIQAELEQNPTLEEKIQESDRIEIEPGTPSEEPAQTTADGDEEYELMARLDEEWRDYFRQNTPRASSHDENEEARRKFMLDSLTKEESLQEHLLRQLALSGLGETETQMGELLIGNINDDGYLATTLEELEATTNFTVNELAQVLAAIQEFDPIGVGSRDLKECLLFQLRREGFKGTPMETLVADHLEELGSRKYAQIARAMKIPLEEAQRMAQHIATLEPKPGRRFTSESAPYVTPEIQIQRVRDEYVVVTNDDQIPHLRISKHYRSLMEDPATSPDVKQYIQEKIKSSAFLIKSIHHRQQTIRSIAQEIVRVQRAFFERGVSALKPLTMSDVADVIGVHETTVSRAIAGKYVQTPQGTYEMKYFFTSGYRTADGQDVSNKTVKDQIAGLIADEDPASPLSDQAIAHALKEKGVNVARRTVAKYREELKILPSHLRKAF